MTRMGMRRSRPDNVEYLRGTCLAVGSGLLGSS